MRCNIDIGSATMSEGKRSLLSIGVFLLIIVAVIVLFATNFITLAIVIPLILMLSGIWVLAMAGMRSQNPQKYERDAFSTLSMGLLLVAIGGAWFIYGYGFGWLYSLVVILVVLAVLAIAAAMKRK